MGGCPDLAALGDELQARLDAYGDSPSDAVRSNVFDGYDALVHAFLCAVPEATSGTLHAWARRLPRGEGTKAELAEIVDVRTNERFVLWRGIDDWTWSGGGRASAFARREATWRKVGHVDFERCSDLALPLVRSDGVAVFKSESCKNGRPPARLVAMALDRDDLVVYDSGMALASAEVTAREIIVERNTLNIDTYPAAPLLRYELTIERGGGRLHVHERLLTPWALALDEFCGTHQCGGFTRGIRVQPDRVDVDLGTGSTVTLQRIANHWQVTSNSTP